MKKIIFAFTLVLSVFLFISCGSSKEKETESITSSSSVLESNNSSSQSQESYTGVIAKYYDLEINKKFYFMYDSTETDNISFSNCSFEIKENDSTYYYINLSFTVTANIPSYSSIYVSLLGSTASVVSRDATSCVLRDTISSLDLTSAKTSGKAIEINVQYGRYMHIFKTTIPASTFQNL